MDEDSTSDNYFALRNQSNMAKAEAELETYMNGFSYLSGVKYTLINFGI